MKIEVKNTKWLFLYRSFLFKLFSFTTNDEGLENIVKALNIKKRKQRIEFVYDEAIKVIDEYYCDDLCKFKNNQCIAQRKNKKNGKFGCCRYCSLVTDKGCPSCNFACKLIYCKTALGDLKLLKLRDIHILKCLSIFQRAILKGDFFVTKEEIINDLYYGPVYSSFKTVLKELFNFKKRKR